MLSRTAQNLYWMARYLERAEATARMISMGQRMALLPGTLGRDEWASILKATGAPPESYADGATEADIVNALVLDTTNPSSIHACLNKARENGKAVRTALTQEMWEGLNDGWRYLEALDPGTVRRELSVILDWVKTRCARFRGSIESTMLRNDGYDFTMLGFMLERADMTLRLLNVKYFLLLPESDVVGGARDYHQWTSLLDAVSGLRAYHHDYKGDYSPWNISDFLILNRTFPRSVSYCYSIITRRMDSLEEAYGRPFACHDLAHSHYRRLKALDMGVIFQEGLHEYVQGGLKRNAEVSFEMSKAYHLGM